MITRYQRLDSRPSLALHGIRLTTMPMRRNAGIAGLQRKNAHQQQYRKVGSQLTEQEVAKMGEQLETFRRQLESFARKYKRDINRDPAFRAHFQTMCSSIGVDPLACPSLSQPEPWLSLPPPPPAGVVGPLFLSSPHLSLFSLARPLTSLSLSRSLFRPLGLSPSPSLALPASLDLSQPLVSSQQLCHPRG